MVSITSHDDVGEIRTYFACSTRAMVADASGADELVPVKPSVHSPFSVVVP